MTCSYTKTHRKCAAVGDSRFLHSGGASTSAFAADKGSLTTYTCSSDPVEHSSFLNASGHLNVSSNVPSGNSCHAGAGADWNGLNNTPFKSLNFDVQESSVKAGTGDSNFCIILDGTTASAGEADDDTVVFFSLKDASSAIDLGNGWTRYGITHGAISSANQSLTPDTVNRIVFHQYPSGTSSTSSIVFDNILLNGDIHPVLKTTATVCPPITGDDSI